MDEIDEIKARINIVDLVSESVRLRRSGKNYSGFCPFHPNSRTAAFVVFPETGTWRCFGQCNEGGDIFKFIMKKEGLDFREALNYLAEKAGVILRPPSAEKQREEEAYSRLHVILEEAVELYRHHLFQTHAGKAAMAYLERRGLQLTTLETFGIGYAPPSWDTCVQHFNAKGYNAEDLIACGLVSERSDHPEEGGVHDRFRNRIMFPIRDAAGKMAGFGGRILDPNDQPKFLNSPQTAIFDKGHLLYGLNYARRSIRSENQVVIVEGYLDVVILHQAGFTNTVSPMGTALTEDQIRLLGKSIHRIILALDPDAAGEKATLRGLQIARQTVERDAELVFDSQGLIRKESRLQVDIRVTQLPAGKDPDEIALRDPEEWRTILAQAKPIVIHVMETLASHSDLEDPKAKSEIAAQIIPLIREVANPIERDTYRQRLARLLKIDERTLYQPQPIYTKPKRGKPKTAVRQHISPPPSQSATLRPYRLEAHCIRLLLRKPDAKYDVDRELQAFGLSRLELQDFEDTIHQQLVDIIFRSLSQFQTDAKQFILQNTPEEIQDTLQQYLSPFSEGEPKLDQMAVDLARSIKQLRLHRINETLKQARNFQEEMQENQEEPSHEMGSYMSMMLTRKTLEQSLIPPQQM